MTNFTQITTQLSQLIRANNFNDALQLCRQHWNDLKHHASFKIQYAQCIYHLHLKPPITSNPDLTIRSLKAIFQLAPPPNLLAFYSLKNLLKSSHPLTIFKSLLQQNPPFFNHASLSLILQTHHPQLDSTQSALKNLTLLYQLAKASHLLNIPQTSLQIASFIIEHFPQNIPDPNRIFFWSSRLKLLNAFHLDPQILIANDYKKLIENEKDWFLFHELANMYFQLNDPQLALQHILFALADLKKIQTDIPLRYKTLYLFWEILQKFHTSIDNSRFSHLQNLILQLFLAAQLPDKIPNSLKNASNLSSDIPENLFVEFKNALQDLALSLRLELPPALTPPLRGIIHSWFPDKGFGFVESNRQTYYFNIKKLPVNPKLISVGASCEFKIQSSFDKKKNKPSQKAIILKIFPNQPVK